MSAPSFFPTACEIVAPWTPQQVRQWARTRPPATPQTMWEIGYRDELSRQSPEALRETISLGWRSTNHAILAAWASEELAKKENVA